MIKIEVGKHYAFDVEGVLEGLYEGTFSVEVLDIKERANLMYSLYSNSHANGKPMNPLVTCRSLQTGEIIQCDSAHLSNIISKPPDERKLGGKMLMFEDFSSENGIEIASHSVEGIGDKRFFVKIYPQTATISYVGNSPVTYFIESNIIRDGKEEHHQDWDDDLARAIDLYNRL